LAAATPKVAKQQIATTHSENIYKQNIDKKNRYKIKKH
jgi:hypothetical protein